MIIGPHWICGGVVARYGEVIEDLRRAYDGRADERDRMEKQGWKLAERAAFLDRLNAAGHRRLLEIGAGTGQDSLFFQDNGLEVVAVDLSPEMVARCRAKGVDAHVRDFLNLGFAPESFDAVYAVNCLLHVPNADLPTVLEGISAVLRPGGLFYLGVYGGEEREGVAGWDQHDPPRFFSFRSDEAIQRFARGHFDLLDFHVVGSGEQRFQSLTLSRP